MARTTPTNQYRRNVVLPPPIDLARNGVLLAALWAAYATVRSVTDDTATVAMANAQALLEFQDRHGIAIEADLQQLINAPGAFVAANIYYLVHFPITVITLIATFLRDRNHSYVVLRNSLITVTGIALLVHLAVPLAPPRMLPGYIDTGAVHGPDPYSLPGSESANQFAAMPSMHVAWAIMVGWALWSLNHIRGLRLVAVAHPAITSVVVVITAHHFVADAAIGAVLAVGSIVLVAGLTVGSKKRRPGNILFPGLHRWRRG